MKKISTFIISLFIIHSFFSQEVKQKKFKTQLSGELEIDNFNFYKSPFFDQQVNTQSSVMVNPALKVRTKQFELIFEPFVRYDHFDKYRTHFDLRQFSLIVNHKKWRYTLGINSYTWTRFTGFSLMDIANRIDPYENPLDVAKLGQPATDINYLFNENLHVQFSCLPYLRIEKYPDYSSRYLFTPVEISNDNINFENHSLKRWYPSSAIRINYTYKKTDFAFQLFHGLNRTPLFTYNTQQRVLDQQFVVMNQTGLEIQHTLKGFILKNEFIIRQQEENTTIGIHPGIEYNFSRLFGSRIELQTMVEYLYDKQKKDQGLPFSDHYIGNFRFDFGDLNNTDIFIKLITNRTNYFSFIDFEFNRRIFNKFKLNLHANFALGNITPTDPMYLFQYNTFIGGKLSWFF